MRLTTDDVDDADVDRFSIEISVTRAEMYYPGPVFKELLAARLDNAGLYFKLERAKLPPKGRPA